MLSIPQKRKWYPLPTGKEQVLALTAGEKLFTHSAGARLGNPSSSPCLALPAVPPTAQALEGTWRCVSPKGLGRSLGWCLSDEKSLHLSTKQRGKLRALPEAAGRGKTE